MNAVDRHARKQVLLARIAFQRNEMQRDMAALREAAEPRQLLRAAIGRRFGGPLGRRLFGGARAPAGADLLTQALSWFKRYRGIAALVGGAVPVLRGGSGWGRALRIAVVAGAAWMGWRATRDR
ncbi:MAG TPA: hypothetical protein VGM74_06040 [Burkholderiaceae bacterium]|jgi:hypothetical protein